MAVETLDPVSSALISTVDLDRHVEVEAKHQKLRAFLEEGAFDAILLTNPDHFAWFTCGGNCQLSRDGKAAAALFITTDARLLICNNTDSGLLFDREVSGLGFQLKERPWDESYEGLMKELCKGRKMACDAPLPDTEDVSQQLLSLTSILSEFEKTRIRELGRLVAHAVEATARCFQQGQTENQIAGELSHRLIKRGVTPVSIQVMADGQGKRYRHWKHGEDQVERYCTVSAVGSLYGLNAGATRTVSFGNPPQNLKNEFRSANVIQTAGLFFSQPGWTMAEIWKRVERMFEKLEFPNEWRQADQACLIGYQASEALFVPNSEFKLQTGMAAFWYPSINEAVAGDTMLVDEDGCEVLTPSVNWPLLEIEIKGDTAHRPDILVRD